VTITFGQVSLARKLVNFLAYTKYEQIKRVKENLLLFRRHYTVSIYIFGQKLRFLVFYSYILNSLCAVLRLTTKSYGGEA
jgi:hypothetical protein